MNHIRQLYDWNSKRIGVFFLVVSLLVPYSLVNSYAENSPIDVKWQMVVLTGDSLCSSYEKTMLEVYSGLTLEYLNLYEISNSAKSVHCLTTEQYRDFESDDDVDLLIVIFDEIIGQKKMGNNEFDGLYLHTGNDRSQNHVIVMCHCSNFENGYETKLPSWILTHELSHFVLSLKGYDYAAVERLVHVIDKKYESCAYLEVGLCDGRIHLKPTTITQPYLVFPPLKMAIGTEPLQSLNDDARNNPMVLGFHKEVTRWWLNDVIDNDTYLNATKQVFVSPLSLYSGLKLETGMELPNGVVMLDHAKEKPTTWEQVRYEKELSLEEKVKIILDYVPEKTLDSQKDNTPFGDLPQYFKQRAEYWVEGKISDKQFFDSVDRLVRMKIIPLQ